MTIAFKSLPNIISLEEFLDLPETKPASEYIDGRIYQKPMPQGKHSLLQGRFLTQINDRGESRQLVYAFPELRCTFAGRSIVPDIAVFEWNNIPLDENAEIMNRITIAPDWIIEILSPDQSSIKPLNKISFAIQNGTKLGWLISPQDRIILVFQGDRLPIFKEGNDVLPVLGNLGDWQLSANDLFELLSFVSKAK